MISKEELYYAYTNGYFPMAENGEILWFSPDPRAIIPIETYKPSKSLRPILNANKFNVKINTAFEQVIRNCAKPRTDEDSAWISEEIIEVYCQMNEFGYAHSVECFFEKKLVGGLYGIAIGSVFFGESMFHTMPNASKVAFHYLIEILKKQKFTLLDTQFINDNVRRFGAIEIPKENYMKLLNKALKFKCSFG